MLRLRELEWHWFIALTVLVTFDLGATERREFYVGVRGLGMGGAQIATVNDETSLLVNPAALGKLRDTFITIADPEIAVGANTEQVTKGDITAFLDPQRTLDLLQDVDQGENLHQMARVFPSIVFPNFGIGFFGRIETDANIGSAGGSYNLNYREDYALVTGFNFRMWDGRIKLGFNTRIVNRAEINQGLPTNSTGLRVKDLANEGLGIASDVGLIVAMPWDWLPTLAAVWRDVGNTEYNVQDGLLYNTESRPETTLSTVDVAVAVFPIVGKRTRTSWTVEYRDVLTFDQADDLFERLHTGFEFNFSDAFFLRGGMNQRYWTAGFEVAMARYQLQLASYGEELGTADNPNEDRRYVFKFAYRF